MRATWKDLAIFQPVELPSFIPPDYHYPRYAQIRNEFTGQTYVLIGVQPFRAREIADELTRYFSDHPFRSGGLMSTETAGLLESWGYVWRISNEELERED